jgi:hypothetical protein
MAAGELVLDEGLLGSESVEGGVDFAGGDAAEAKGLAQRVTGRGGIEHPRRREFRCRIEQPGDDERQCQAAATLRRTARQQVVEADAPGDGQRDKHVAMRRRTADLEAFAADRSESLAAQGGTQSFDALDRQLGEVGEGAVLDLAVLAAGFPQQEGRSGVAVRDLGDA